MQYSSQSVEKLVEELTRLPGIGRKSAQRLAFYLLKASRDEAIALAESIRAVKERVGSCSVCGNFTEDDPCLICQDPKRPRDVICVVEQPMDVLASHVSPTPYSVLAFNRASQPEDPWLSANDHSYLGRSQFFNDETHSMLYGESSFPRWEFWRNNHLGANVFIRNSTTAGNPIPEPGSFALLGFAILGLAYARRRRA